MEEGPPLEDDVDMLARHALEWRAHLAWVRRYGPPVVLPAPAIDHIALMEDPMLGCEPDWEAEAVPPPVQTPKPLRLRPGPKAGPREKRKVGKDGREEGTWREHRTHQLGF